MDHPDQFGVEVQNLGRDLGHHRIGALPHVDGADIETATAVSVKVYDRNRRRRRRNSLKSDRQTATAADLVVAPIKWPVPAEPFDHTVEYLVDRGVMDDRAAGLRPTFPQQVLSPKLEFVKIQRRRDHIHMGVIGPCRLRRAEAAQRAGRRTIGVDGKRFDRDVVDVVGPRRGEARLLRHPRPDVGIGTTVPDDLAAPRNHPAVVVDAALNDESARMFGHHEELLFHGERYLDRPAAQERQRRDQCFELDIELAAEAAAEMRNLDPHAVLGPAEQPRDFDADKGRPL